MTRFFVTCIEMHCGEVVWLVGCWKMLVAGLPVLGALEHCPHFSSAYVFFPCLPGFSPYLRWKSQRHWASRSQRSRGCRHGHVWLSGEAESQSQKINLRWLGSAQQTDETLRIINLFVLTIVVFWYFDICLILSLCNSVRILEFVTQMDPPANSACAWPGSPVR